MTIYAEVNTDLHTNRYCSAMGQKRRRPGSPPGQLKPVKRPFDPGFPDRLKEAMIDRWPGPWGSQISLLADELGCTRATLLNYTKSGKRSGEPLLLLAIADALNVELRWLLTAAEPKAKVQSLTPEQTKVLQVIDQLVDKGTRDFWISQGEDLLRRQPSLGATAPESNPGTRPTQSHSATPTTNHQPSTRQRQ